MELEAPIVDEVRAQFELLREKMSFLTYAHGNEEALWCVRGLSSLGLDLKITFAYGTINSGSLAMNKVSSLNAYLMTMPPVASQESLRPYWTVYVGDNLDVNTFEGVSCVDRVLVSVARLMSLQAADGEEEDGIGVHYSKLQCSRQNTEPTTTDLVMVDADDAEDAMFTV